MFHIKIYVKGLKIQNIIYLFIFFCIKKNWQVENKQFINTQVTSPMVTFPNNLIIFIQFYYSLFERYVDGDLPRTNSIAFEFAKENIWSETHML